MKGYFKKLFPLLIIVVTVFSVQQWLSIPVSTTFISWGVNFYVIYIILKFKKSNIDALSTLYITKYDWNLIYIYFVWLLFNSTRGAFIAENYWEWKQLIAGLQSLSLPLFIYVFSVPIIVKNILKYWLKYALFIFLIFIFFLKTDAYHFYLGPLFVVGCFMPMVPKRWRIIIGGLLITMLFIDLGARSQVIKSAIVLLIALGVYFRRFISTKLLKLIHAFCYILPIILLYLGLSGTYNIFKDISSNEGKYVEKKIVNGKVVESDLSADTRTFIYVEVIESALKHNYVVWGRTPARGNDSLSFGSYNAEVLKTGKYERHGNELCHTNVFTWLGLVGVVLYSLIYFRSSYLAIYRSNNIYIKYLGCFIAFRWVYGWIEDFNAFNIMNIALWMMIAMGISIQFRSMSNEQFKSWFIGIFNKSLKNRTSKM